MKLPFTSRNEWHSRWLVFPSYGVLHRVAKLYATSEQWKEWPHDKRGTTVCGLTGKLSMPGIISRMGRKRCTRCCKILGIKQGNGAPYNEGIDT